ncbi:uncharacterized protein LOC121251547 [Juglans microcarpa x Juglans regia]|uniref:uncharacterized protein LOC121251547 n=1 Tax=Juglans microcarpa x Juglans regia TaxID=2249226 RepID=UPI001B7EBB70|nr:uncharacterized protein LOC121251547 [Juglans microcarpa x Juglans regia]
MGSGLQAVQDEEAIEQKLCEDRLVQSMYISASWVCEWLLFSKAQPMALKFSMHCLKFLSPWLGDGDARRATRNATRRARRAKARRVALGCLHGSEGEALGAQGKATEDQPLAT